MSLLLQEQGRLAARLLGPASWLSGRLSFSRKYLLVGGVMLAALVLLSAPLLDQARDAAQQVQLEQRGLQSLRSQARWLFALVKARGDDLAGPPGQPPRSQNLATALLSQLGPEGQARAAAALPASAASAAPSASSASQEAGERLRRQLHQLQALQAGDDAQRRFAAYTAAINAVLSLMRDGARQHRLNVDPALDSAFDMLSNRLPLLIETLGRQQDALALPGDSMSSYALGAQVLLSESAPALQAGVAQLEGPGSGAILLPQLGQLLKQIERQQEVVDKLMAGSGVAADELRQLAGRNQGDAQALLQDCLSRADAQLLERLEALQRSQWGVGALLMVTVLAIAYLFAGIYVSTLRSLRRLAQGTEAFCAGQLDTRIHVDTQDELVGVARNFNSVADEVGRLLALVREQNESRQRELERQVSERTLELADKNAQLHRAARRMQDELALARDMQQAILPQQFPDTAEFALHACMHPARELGGDFYDCLALPDGRWAFLVADVSGKGVGAAFFMAVSRTVLQDLIQSGLAPAEVLARANDVLTTRNPMELFVTACLAIYEPRSGELIYACAGHPEPLLRRAGGRTFPLPCPRELALGILPEQRYTQRQALLQPGDTLLLYTDGITEAFDDAQRPYGDARLAQRLSQGTTGSARQWLDALVADVARHVDGAEASDDLTCLVLCRKKGALMPSHPPLELKNKTLLLEHRLASRVEEIEPLARAVSAALRDREDLAFAVNLCLEELITNTIQHGLRGDPGRQIQVRLSRSDDWLEILLKDDAPPFDPFNESPPPSLEAELDERAIGGLGVHMVKSMMDEVHAFYDGSGNLIVLLKTLKR